MLEEVYRAEKSLGKWLREISSSSCLTFLQGPAWVLLSKICQDFFSALYIRPLTEEGFYRRLNDTCRLIWTELNGEHATRSDLRDEEVQRRSNIFDSRYSRNRSWHKIMQNILQRSMLMPLMNELWSVTSEICISFNVVILTNQKIAFRDDLKGTMGRTWRSDSDTAVNHARSYKTPARLFAS